MLLFEFYCIFSLSYKILEYYVNYYYSLILIENGKDIFWAFMYLEKAYDTIDRHGMWQMLRVYEVGGKLLKAVSSFYVLDSRACVRVGNDGSDWFPVNVGLR